MRVLGFDISSVATGWAVIEDGTLTVSGVIRPVDELKDRYGTKKATKAALRESDIFLHVTRRASQIMEQVKPDNVVVEDCFLKRNASVLRILSRLSGGVLYRWLQLGSRTPYVVMASHARASLGCRGTSTKEQVMAFIKARYGIQISDDNVADAFILAMYGYLKDRQAPSGASVAKARHRSRLRILNKVCRVLRCRGGRHGTAR